MNRLITAGFVSAVVITLTATAMASGPKWTESGDAGSLPADAQVTVGNNVPLLYINGGLGMATLLGEIDFEDMYLIRIVDPMFFRATTDPDDDVLMKAFAEFNTQLWLFKPVSEKSHESLGFLGNNDHPFTGSTHALLISDPTDDSPPLVDEGLYYLAITRWVDRDRNDPISGGGEIFLQKEPTEISGPDGKGGDETIAGWTGDIGKFDGQYKIALQGATFAEIICPWDIDNSGSVGASDLLSLLASWGPCKGCPADFDHNGTVGASDLLALLANWGPCP